MLFSSWLSCCAALQHSFCNSLSCSRGNITLAQRLIANTILGLHRLLQALPFSVKNLLEFALRFLAVAHVLLRSSGGRRHTRWKFLPSGLLNSSPLVLPFRSALPLVCTVTSSPFSESYDHSLCPSLSPSFLPKSPLHETSLDLDLPHRGQSLPEANSSAADHTS